MSAEVQSRTTGARGGRGAGRGARGGYAGRGGSRNQTRTNGDSKHDADGADDDGEIVQMKKLYGPKIAMIKDIYPDWSEIDIGYALQENDGDENQTVTRISEGTSCCIPTSQFPLDYRKMNRICATSLLTQLLHALIATCNVMPCAGKANL